MEQRTIKQVNLFYCPLLHIYFFLYSFEKFIAYKNHHVYYFCLRRNKYFCKNIYEFSRSYQAMPSYPSKHLLAWARPVNVNVLKKNKLKRCRLLYGLAYGQLKYVFYDGNFYHLQKIKKFKGYFLKYVWI